MKWDIPNKIDYRYLAYVPDYTLKYFNIQDRNITGFLSDIWNGVSSAATGVWHGITSIPKEVFGTGYVIAKHNNNVSSAIKQGMTSINTVLNKQYPNSNSTQVREYKLPEIKPTQQSSSSPNFLQTIGKIGGETAAKILRYKIEKAAGVLKQNPNQVWNESVAWSMAHRPQLESMGYPTPESAADAVLWKNNGYPPAPNQQPSSIFSSIGSDVKKYWWVLALGAGVILMSRR